MRFKGKVALVTGSGRGIGAAIARGFAAEGADLVLASRTIGELERHGEQLRETYGVETLAVAADLADKAQARHLLETALGRFSGIDILVNCAGMAMVAPSVSLTEEQWRKCLSVNLDSAFFCSQLVGAHMIERKAGGTIVNITSIAAHSGLPERAAYGASKGGVLQLTQTLAVEWGKFGIRVNAVTPGFIWTESLQQLIDRGVHNPTLMTSRIPAGRLGLAEDIVGPVLFLASRDSDYMTGTVLKVDGGWLANGYV